MIHGHKKTDKKKSEQEVKQENELSEKISSKLAQFFAIRKNPVVQNKIPALLEFTTILMQLCPDITTVFNYRRELISKIIESQDAGARAKTLAGDIKLITKIMQGDPKSYTLWSYRQWLVVKLFEINPQIIAKEKQLCAMLLMKDQKNFHVWNYRNWANTIHMDVDTELQFTKSKINTNPFNFSAYHFRSKYLIWKYEKGFESLDAPARKECVTYGMPKAVFEAELETVRTAIFLNPKEQAPWLYYSWLLKQLLPSILLQIKPTSQVPSLAYQLCCSLKVKDIKKVLKTQNPQFELASTNHPNIWEIRFKQPATLQEITSVENLQQVIVQNQSAGRRLIWDATETSKQIRSIYEAEQNFIREVNQSEENQCRFGWLQLLDLYRCMLFLGTSSQEWNNIVAKGMQVFDHLKNQAKGQKYIEMQHKEWQRLSQDEKLSQVEAKLKSRGK